MEKKKILFADDDPEIREALRLLLNCEGYDTVEASCGEEVLEQMDHSIDLVILDVMMPRMDGLTACSKIREFSDVPIILLTAKTTDMDKLLGFDQGADDYLTKPFNILELKARIRAMLRRSGGSAPKEAPKNELVGGPIRLDLDARNAYRSGELVDLTAKEFDVIEHLMRNPNRVFSRENLLDTIWAYEYRSDIRTVDVHIRRLREKLEENPAQPKHIMTKWGVGYYFKN